MIVRRIPLTSVTCIAALNRTWLNADERRRMRPKMRPPGPVGSWTRSFRPWRRSRRPASDTIRTYGTRFMNGSSVTDCVYRLTCCFVSVVDGRTRSHFALVSRSARMIEMEPGCTMRLVPGTERGTNGRVSWSFAIPSSWPPCSSRRWCQWWRLRHRGATPSGAVDSGDAAWTISGRGSDPEPKD